MNQIEVTCAACGGRFGCPPHFAGQQLPCPNCQSAIQIPAAGQPAPIRPASQTADPFTDPFADAFHDAVNSTPPLRESSFSIGEYATASNPGKIKPDLYRWFTFYPTWPIVWIVALVLSVIFAFAWHWSLWIVAALMAAMNWHYWHRVVVHFQYGNALPGVVISLEPMLIAFSTDMTTGVGSFPAVRVIKKRFDELGGQTPKVGTRLIGVALYARSSSSVQHWEDVDPVPIECVTDDPKVHARLMSTMTEQDFQELFTWLRGVPRKAGLYFIQPDGSAKEYQFVES
ncbi:MAG: DUF3239 domain-containing protein [Planctomycetales bacterium]|nr:DUF3239 domain-containing protein [Planctomycetales bacterium]